ncbi:cation:proton antiporter regulatory subunit [Micromonospora eburnea]|uniref:Potassium/proton antiporter regulatory subunit, CPA2 family n=1 Tax=Micromonospora eburnea TaxID=227316 RepID=A0A1C6USU0_9ACTN|nr:TrkA C-terminal domain-containing protein [Micromonospora eburnea]SCL57041.1 potassium/proton antiporter regulatory subunit, CPA2 family [Micromonospora eburnea]
MEIMKIERTALPGVGINHTTTTADGQRLGVICHLTGRRDLVFYDPEDPQAVAATVVLQADESHQIADLLDATITIDHVAHLEQQITGITAARIRIPAGSAYADRPIRDTRAHAGALIVAVIHDQGITTAPDSDLVLRHGDTVVAVGDQDAITALADRLTAEHPPVR